MGLVSPGSGGGGSATVYGFHIDSGESDPEACVSYLEGAVGMTPAHMDFSTGKFDFGSWGRAFFLPRPCMLRYDGTVDYYLDPDDYSKKADGTASDVADDSYPGNAMMEWGRGWRRIWYKIVPDAGDPTSASVYIADRQADEGYRAWSFVNNRGELAWHFYTPIYNGSIDASGRLRSLSGKANTALCQSKTAAQEIAAAEANNPGADKLWYTEVYADVVLIDLLLILMGKSLDTQAVFGAGCGGHSGMSSMLDTGTMDDKGLFWGEPSGDSGVKVFGMEHWWGNQWRRYAGHIIADYVHRFKFTRGTEDGSTAEDYNLTGDGYLSGETGAQENGYLKALRFSDSGFQQAETGGSSAAYFCDSVYVAGGTRYAIRGGATYLNTGRNGAFAAVLDNGPEHTYWAFGAAPSCKP